MLRSKSPNLETTLGLILKTAGLAALQRWGMYAKNTKKIRVEPFFFKNYITFARATANSPLWRQFYAKVNGKPMEVLRDGRLSCAFHLTSILKLFSLVDDIQLTVHRTLDDMLKSGWYKIKKPRVGCVILWAEKPASKDRVKRDSKIYSNKVKHAGIYLGGDKAISNRDHKRTPIIHSLHYRPVEAFFWHKKLNRP